MVTVDPRAFAIVCKALAVAKLVAERLPHLPFEADQLKAFPQDVVKAARAQQRDANWRD